ncbi:Non-repetitive/WGA-negative nucleoporin C-terminal-domain-containing protein [Fimicolochytrium jonesii]|uniref:Non-repetitive/WGA-negative nucleoporin C-terminal-domain-containing protein n=1 Tax=Fimicolochytrium jonesii TaxID=1396493 RepID=UPI0022FEC15C|nr:Non-repetitive/WGA-negative nucleoporin C-terminal-domain-containing protein [Fimicolochytrium jonesii]KAI8826080.1 Non-repetitive/WGA-negative nucleoporin C-terminal-domain-containing protein [Fimicolochytrium jonesii]
MPYGNLDDLARPWGGMVGQPPQAAGYGLPARDFEITQPQQHRQQQQSTLLQRHDRLRNAAAVLDENLQRDRYPDLWELLVRLSDEQLREASTTLAGVQNYLRADGFVSLPNYVYEQYDSVQCKTFMGLFPEIERVWITMDSKLYLWNFNDNSPNATSCYDDQEQLICSVGLVRPTPGVFLEQIDYLLVVATRLEIIILGVAFAVKGNPSTELTIFRTDLSIPTDSEHILQIEGSKEGRIFLRTLSGKLLELQYQATEGWFTRRIRLINHSASALSMVAPTFLRDIGLQNQVYLMTLDLERKILYTVTSRNTVQLIYLGRDGKSFHRVKSVSDALSRLSSGSRTDEGIAIQALYPVSNAESQKIQMVAITTSGDRLFFTVYSSNDRSGWDGQPPSSEPNTLELVYILPLVQRIVGPGLSLHESYYASGLLLATSAMSQDVDRLYGVAVHTGAIAQQASKFWIDNYGYHDQEGKIWQISEMATRSTVPTAKISKRPEAGNVLNELATQLEGPARSFRVLTNQGIWRLKKLRPLDILCENIITPEEQRSGGGFEEFLHVYGSAEACAMCLAVACQHPASETLFQEHVGSKGLLISTASRLFDDFGGQPSMAQLNSGFDGSGPLGYAMYSPEIRHSGRHDGLALYLTRVLKPVWKNKVVVKEKGYASNFSPQTLSDILSALDSLGAFLKERQNFTALPTPESRPQSVEGEAWRAEQESLHNLDELLRISTETVSLVLMLAENKLDALIKPLPKAQQEDVDGLTYEAAITTQKGLETIRALMAAYIDREIAEERNMEIIGEQLQTICPSICRQNDVILYKGIESIQSARNQPSADIQAMKLSEALSLFTRVILDIPFNKLQEINENLRDMECFEGIIDLTLNWARAQDVNEGAEARNSRYNAGYGEALPQTEYQESGLVRRGRAYDIIFQTIGSLDVSGIQNGGIYGQRHSRDHLARTRFHLIKRALDSDDVSFHEAFYKWLIEQDKTDELLKLHTPYLEKFLTQASADPGMMELLARYYVQNERFYDAARVYRMLADAAGLTFHDRLTFLNFAVVQARTALNTERNINRQEMEDILEEAAVAEVQAELLAVVTRTEVGLTDEALHRLSECFLPMNDLFNHYAKPCKLYEIQLHMIHVSETNNPRFHAEQIWSELLRKTKESAIEANRDVFTVLQDKVREIGRRFISDENIFPIPFLVNQLEQECYQAVQQNRPAPEHGWAVKVFRQVKVPFPLLFRAYNEIFDAKLPPWSSPRALTFLLEDIAVLISDWLRERKSGAGDPSTHIPVQIIDDAIQKYLVTVHDGEARELVARLQTLAHRIRES